jgi:hypothetical protein
LIKVCFIKMNKQYKIVKDYLEECGGQTTIYRNDTGNKNHVFRNCGNATVSINFAQEEKKTKDKKGFCTKCLKKVKNDVLSEDSNDD